MNIEQARFNMIEQQIRPWDVLDPAVLELLAVVKREDFVPPAYRALAFVDTEIPLPTADGAAECMLAPKVEARLLQELAWPSTKRVLEVGAGSGYMAALLAHSARRSPRSRSTPAWRASPPTTCVARVCATQRRARPTAPAACRAKRRST